MLEGPRIETFQGMTLVGLHRPMGFAEPLKMRELWQALRPRLHEVRERTSEGFISMRIHADLAGAAPSMDARFEQWAAVQVNEPREIPDGMESHWVGAGLYAVFTYRGRADAFGPAAAHIYGEWLPQSSFVLADREFFEILGPLYRPDDPEATEDVWIPIQDRTSP